jgi:CDP-4-dehydro-6-deoxyglucose reductase
MANTRTIYQAQIDKIIDHTPTVRELFIKITEPSEFHFKAGQFVMLHVPTAEGAKPALRAYSIASDDRQTNGFRLLFKYVPTGVASTFVWSLEKGHSLQFTGPFGRVFFHEPPLEQIVFMCTGTGLAQHLCYLSSKADLHPQVKYFLLFGLQNESETFCITELEEFKKKLPNFDYEVVLSRPPTQWSGRQGYIQHHIEKLNYKTTPTLFYLCGNGKMIQQTKAQLLEVDGLAPTQIFSEAFD